MSIYQQLPSALDELRGSDDKRKRTDAAAPQNCQRRRRQNAACPRTNRSALLTSKVGIPKKTPSHRAPNLQQKTDPRTIKNPKYDLNLHFDGNLTLFYVVYFVFSSSYLSETDHRYRILHRIKAAIRRPWLFAFLSGQDEPQCLPGGQPVSWCPC